MEYLVSATDNLDARDREMNNGAAIGEKDSSQDNFEGNDVEESKDTKHILKIYPGDQIYITCVGADVEGLLYRTSTTDNAVVPQEHHL